MRRLAFSLFAILCIAAAAYAALPLGPWAPIIEPPGADSTGGPDLYGYVWKDTYEPGGPVYNWKDISATGTLVTGLGDDNYVGPFPIGFPFHYYWYDITQYWIGSNAYIKFGSAFNIAPTIPQTIPLATVPNDFAAIYLADWDAGTPPGACQVYRWNNADSLVISYINLHPWTGPGVVDGPHTFQVIFSRLDSNITFQYAAQSGTLYNGDILIGIESVNGVPGLEHSHDVYRSPNTAIKFYHPPTTSYIVHDMAAVASANANSEGFFLLNAATHTPYGKVKNVGNQTESTFQVNCTIRQDSPTGLIVYNQTVSGGPLAPSAELEVNFPVVWNPMLNAQYLYYINVALTGDLNPTNDQKLTEVRVMSLPGTMMFDDGSNNQAWSWIGGNGGLGMRFVPPSYPVDLDSILFFIPTASTSSHPFVAQVLDDNGPNGMPGTVLLTQNINTPTGGIWYGTTTSLSISSGAVYVAWQMVDSLTAALGTDNTNSLGSRQSYEYTGVWAVYRNAETYDVMIRAKVSQPGVIPNVTVTLLPVNPPIIIPPTGGPFDWDITLHNGEATPQVIDIWNIIQGPPTRPGWGPVLDLTIPAGANINRIRTQQVSDRFPAGAYTYISNIGEYPSTIWDSDSFPFTKAAIGADGWANGQTAAGPTPAEYALHGAIPNPFNPTTTLSFALPQAGQVKLSVYNVTGREVATLVNGWRDAGNHEVVFDATGLASGLYIYQLSAGDFHATGKMMLMK